MNQPPVAGRWPARKTRGKPPRRYREDDDKEASSDKRRKPAEQSCSLFKLPDDVWTMVRDLAGAAEALRFALACQQSLEYVQSVVFWERYEQPGFGFYFPGDRWILRFFVEACIKASWPLRRLTVSTPYYRDKRGWSDYKHYSLNQVTVETLIINGTSTLDDAQEERRVLDEFKCIHNLLTGNLVDICRNLQNRPNTRDLRLLELSHQHFKDESLRFLQGLAELHSLKLDRCPNLTDAGLTFLRLVPKLATLSIRFCDSINGSGLRHLPIAKLTFAADSKRAIHLLEQIGSLARLQELDLFEYYCLSPADMKLLENLTFQSLKLTLVEIASDAVLRKLADQTGLHSLRFRQCRNITTAGLQQLQRCPALEELHLIDCDQVMDLTGLSTFPALRTVCLASRGATRLPVGLDQCESLQRLQLQGYKITDATISDLTRCLMQELELRSCYINADVTGLKKCRSLREFATTLCRGDPPEGVLQQLRQDLPNLRVKMTRFICASPYSWESEGPDIPASLFPLYPLPDEA